MGNDKTTLRTNDNKDAKDNNDKRLRTLTTNDHKDFNTVFCFVNVIKYGYCPGSPYGRSSLKSFVHCRYGL